MNAEQFDEILQNRLESIRQTLGAKAQEYASEDRLYNFKRSARIGKETPEEALWGMARKHLVSVIDMVEHRIMPTEHMVNEKIGDMINYLVLLEAVFKEQL
jgi:hypothetical protein